WHENLLQPIHRYCGLGICVLISRHADGQLLTEVCRRMNVPLIRGSTNRGGVEAVRQLVRVGRNASLAITPDGPRGPRRRVQTGTSSLAAQPGLPIVPAGFGPSRAWRLGSWDRFVVPRPFSQGTCVIDKPIPVPETAAKEELEHYRLLVEQALF